MTAFAAPGRNPSSWRLSAGVDRRNAGVAVVAALGCGVLAARPALLAHTAHPSTALALLFAALLVVGLVLPVPPAATTAPRPSVRTFAFATVVGVLAFASGRALIGGHAPLSLTLSALALNTLAAVAEEVWFRRLCYGLLAPVGPGFAIAVTSGLFAAVHVSTYGFAILPLDLAAGALLGWQRAVTGSWAAPATTHVLANLFVLL
jgi:membrane protease YdiL (CAAX protease family)